eukprot:NODE_42_length_34079_cov_0.552619.p2 type:complete len:433 gc:universal NODE_42_length_34079_cov_0.552619:2648-3946(+)
MTPIRKESLPPSKSLPVLNLMNVPKLPRSFSKLYLCDNDPKAIKLQLSSVLSIPNKRWEFLNQNKDFGLINGAVGITNNGNTCFMNSTIQMLFHIKILSQYFINERYISDLNIYSETKGNVAKSFASLLRSMNSSKVVNGKSFKDEISKHLVYFEGYEMHDAQEFLINLLDALSEDLNRAFSKIHKVNFDILEKQEDSLTPENKAKLDWNKYQCVHRSLIFDLFGGQFESSIICKKCYNKTYSFDMFWDISLPMKSRKIGNSDLNECLDSFVEVEEMEYHCSKCGHLKGDKQQLIYKWPAILMCHLKRFSYMLGWNKNTSDIKLPMYLSTINYSSKIKGSDSDVNYIIISIICHYGSLDSGHYIAYCYDNQDVKWYCLNDEDVSEYIIKLHKRGPSFEFRKKKRDAKEEEFIKDLGKHAYIVVYQKSDILKD